MSNGNDVIELDAFAPHFYLTMSLYTHAISESLYVKSTFFYNPHTRDSTLLNKNQCLVKTEALPVSLGIKQEVNNASTALCLQQTLWILIPRLCSFLFSYLIRSCSFLFFCDVLWMLHQTKEQM